MQITSISNYPKPDSSQKKAKQPAFTSEYEINGDSIGSRQQVFTVGMLMSNFWIRNARNTFNDIKRNNIMGKFNIYVNDLKDPTVERILQYNRIEFRKVENKNNYLNTFRAIA